MTTDFKCNEKSNKATIVKSHDTMTHEKFDNNGKMCAENICTIIVKIMRGVK